MIEAISQALLNSLVQQARTSPRRRKNHNFHSEYAEPCQRMLNALEPDSYVRPHRHLLPPRPETFVVLRGSFLLLLFKDDGHIAEALFLSTQGDNMGADVPAGNWHSILALESGSVFFETKPGPYCPIDDKDWAPWAPREGSPEAAGWLETVRRKVLEMKDA